MLCSKYYHFGFLNVNKMKYQKVAIRGYKTLNMYPVYIEDVYNGKEPFKVVGIREINMYYREDLVKAFMSEWKVIARREDLK